MFFYFTKLLSAWYLISSDEQYIEIESKTITVIFDHCIALISDTPH